MVHAVRIRDGKASYCNRWVHTSRVEQEERAGWALHTKSERAGRQGAARLGRNRVEHGWCWQQVGCACQLLACSSYPRPVRRHTCSFDRPD